KEGGAFRFDVHVTEWGQAERVRLKDSSPEGSGIEPCVEGALRDMQLRPQDVWDLHNQVEVDTSSRRFIGNPAAAAAAGGFSLGAWFLIAGGATVIVMVAIYYAARWSKYKSCSAQHDRDRERCREVKKATCWESTMERLAYCNRNKGETGFPPLNED